VSRFANDLIIRYDIVHGTYGRNDCEYSIQLSFDSTHLAIDRLLHALVIAVIGEIIRMYLTDTALSAHHYQNAHK